MRFSWMTWLSIAVACQAGAEELSGRQINQNATALVQAFLNLPETLIGGVALEDRSAFLSLVSHYGDIDFARGYFKLGGDGARASDTPVSRPFAMKMVPREGKLPLCVIAQGAYRDGPAPPVAFVSFEPYWRWKDVTGEYLPEEIDLDQPWFFLPAPDGNDIIVGLRYKYRIEDGREFYGYGPMKGRLAWEEGQFSWVPFDDARFFESAILEIPPRYLADIPLRERGQFWRSLQDDPDRFDRANGWLHFFRDEQDHSAASMFWAKLLRRSGGEPYFFVHMPKPFADGKPPREDQTYVLRKEGAGWKDVTRSVIPRRMDLTHHYRLRRDGVIEVGPWVEFERSDDSGKAWKFGVKEFELRWRNSNFQWVPMEGESFTKN